MTRKATSAFLTFFILLVGCKESVFYLEDGIGDDINLFKESNHSIKLQVVGTTDGLNTSFYLKAGNTKKLDILELLITIENVPPKSFWFSTYCSAKEFRSDTLQSLIQKIKLDTCELIVLSMQIDGYNLHKKHVHLKTWAKFVIGHDTVKIDRLITLTRKVERGFSIH